MEAALSLSEISKIMNEWMRRYIESPYEFERSWKNIFEFERERLEGKEPSYGETCSAYMMKIHQEFLQKEIENGAQ